jgi:hypothetical protein
MMSGSAPLQLRWLHPHSLRSPAVNGAASRLASLGPVGPPLIAGPLRLDGNEGPLTRASSKALQPEGAQMYSRSSNIRTLPVVGGVGQMLPG